jgi:hypothetical protein
MNRLPAIDRLVAKLFAETWVDLHTPKALLRPDLKSPCWPILLVP